MTGTEAVDVLADVLERSGSLPLSAEGRRHLLQAGVGVRRVEVDRDLVRAGERLSQFALLLDGMACRYRTLEDGRRQIVAFHVPGELCDLSGLRAGVLNCATATLELSSVALLPRAVVLGWMERRPRLRELLWRALLADTARTREWLVNLGRHAAYQRTAHLLCELVQRLRAAGLGGAPGEGWERGWECELPLTQAELADALGLTPVHVGRVLQDLRARGLAELGARRLLVRDWVGLAHAAGFDGAYLNPV